MADRSGQVERVASAAPLLPTRLPADFEAVQNKRWLDARRGEDIAAAPEKAAARAPLHGRLVDEGRAYHQRGQRDLAQACYRKALALTPDDADALHYLGVLRHQAGSSAEAADLIAKAISIKQEDAIPYNSLGVVLEALDRRKEAIQAYDRAVSIRSDYAEAWSHRGNALLALGQPAQALASYDRALATNPFFPEALSNRGAALYQLRRFAEALESCDRALKARPDYAAARNNRASALLALGRAGDAVADFDRTLALDPKHAEALYNRGKALVELNRYEDALAAYDEALKLNPRYAKALNNRGNVLKDQGRLAEAIASYRNALAIKPDYAEASSNLLFAQQYDGRISNEELLSEARRFGAMFDRPAAAALSNSRTRDRPLRVGYLSGDFHSHPVGSFSVGVLEAHNRATVEVFCYANAAKSDPVTARFQRAAHRWRSIADLSDADAAALIVRDRIDILVDLSGHTAHNRLPLFALRPAPVQASWLGYPGTTGLGAIDYLIMDEHAVRPGEENGYTEAIVRLPHGRFCYSPPDYAPPVVDPPSLGGNVVTFGSFHNIAKIGPEVMALWAQVLRATPNARLLLKWKALDDDGTRRRFSDAFHAAGVDPSRLAFRRTSQHADHLAQYGEIDIALDPFPFSGALNTAEAFWMGVPVVTFPGDRAASRQMVGAFEDLGLAECVARSPDDYVARAAALANDAERLTSIRRGLRARMKASPLCDGKSFASALEYAYDHMWRRWRRGQPAAPIDIASLATPASRVESLTSRSELSANCVTTGGPSADDRVAHGAN